MKSLRKIGLCFTFLLALSSLAIAQETMLRYFTGQVEILQGNQIREADFGIVLRPDSRIRLGEGSVAEIGNSRQRVILSAPGTYSVRRLFSVPQDRAPGPLQSLGARINSLSDENSSVRSRSSLGGVRGDSAQERQPDWAGMEDGSAFEDGLRALEDQNVFLAYELFETSYLSAFGTEVSVAAWYLGYTAMLLGFYSEAGELFDEVVLSDLESEQKSLFLLSSAELMLTQGQFSRVFDILEQAENTGLATVLEQQRHAYFLAMAFAGLGDIEARNQALQRVTELNADPALTAVAEEIFWNE